MELIHDYMKNDKLRHELNALAGKNVSANRCVLCKTVYGKITYRSER